MRTRMMIEEDRCERLAATLYNLIRPLNFEQQIPTRFACSFNILKTGQFI